MKKNQSIKNQELKTGFPFVCYQETLALCGQPQPGDLEEFKNKSWTHVLNLRNDSELDHLTFDLPDTCKKLHLKYSHIPVIEGGNFNKEALDSVHCLLSDSSGEKIIIHCASGMRSIMVLMAHLLLSKNYSPEELFPIAEEMGLSQPQMLVRLFQTLNAV